jgi:hypothetical protein
LHKIYLNICILCITSFFIIYNNDWNN